jgi:hypothetical protein
MIEKKTSYYEFSKKKKFKLFNFKTKVAANCNKVIMICFFLYLFFWEKGKINYTFKKITYNINY